MIAFLIVVGYLYWRIAAKAGYSGAMGLLMLVPIANLVMFFIFVFSEWPIQRELKALRMNQPHEYGDYKS